MTRLITGIALAAVVALSASSPAWANPDLNLIGQHAAQAWNGQAPACGQVHVQAGDLTGRTGDAQYAGAYPTGVAGWGDPATCTITLDIARNSAWSDGTWCHLATHEYGHVLGLGHSPELNVMNPAHVYDLPIPACDAVPARPSTRPHVHHRHHVRHRRRHRRHR